MDSVAQIDITIRTERKTDHRAVEALTREAFFNLHVPGCSEHLIVHELRNSPAFIPALDFVARSGGLIIGSILYSHSQIVSDDGAKHPTLTFGPLSVLPTWQGRGVGSLLVLHSLGAARALGHAVVAIYGDPAYYRRFGFESARAYDIRTAGNLYAKALQVLALSPGALTGVSGRFFEDPVFDQPDEAVEAFDSLFPPMEKRVTDTQAAFRAIAGAVVRPENARP